MQITQFILDLFIVFFASTLLFTYRIKTGRYPFTSFYPFSLLLSDSAATGAGGAGVGGVGEMLGKATGNECAWTLRRRGVSRGRGGRRKGRVIWFDTLLPWDGRGSGGRSRALGTWRIPFHFSTHNLFFLYPSLPFTPMSRLSSLPSPICPCLFVLVPGYNKGYRLLPPSCPSLSLPRDAKLIRAAYNHFGYSFSGGYLPVVGDCAGSEGAALFGCGLLTSYLFLFIA